MTAATASGRTNRPTNLAPDHHFSPARCSFLLSISEGIKRNLKKNPPKNNFDKLTCKINRINCSHRDKFHDEMNVD